MAESITNVLIIFLGGVAGISLLVGGIGIMNIMLVSVTERTREIGLRKALGAHKSHILTQFLTESALLSLIGGVLGILLGWGLAVGVGIYRRERMVRIFLRSSLPIRSCWRRCSRLRWASSLAFTPPTARPVWSRWRRCAMNKSTFKNGWRKALMTAVLVSLLWTSDQVSAAPHAVIEPDEPVLAVDLNENSKSSSPDHLLAVGGDSVLRCGQHRDWCGTMAEPTAL